MTPLVEKYGPWALIAEATRTLEIGLLINNAGVVVPGSFVWHDRGELERAVAVNMRALTLSAHLFSQAMVARPH